MAEAATETHLDVTSKRSMFVGEIIMFSFFVLIDLKEKEITLMISILPYIYAKMSGNFSLSARQINGTVSL